jgi:hypothetical protein
MNWGIRWVLFGLAIGLVLEAYHFSSQVEIVNNHEIFGLPLPSSVIVHGTVQNIRSSNGALVFDVENNGKITCYWRHPPENLFLFKNDFVKLSARIDPTPSGRLCIVLDLIEHGAV